MMNYETVTSTINHFANVVVAQANTGTAQAAVNSKDLWFSFMGIDWSVPTWDIVILFFVIVTVIIYSFTLGRDRIVTLLISTYLSLAIATNLPYVDNMTKWLNKNVHLSFQISAFLLVFIVLFIFISRSSLLHGLNSLAGSWWQTILFSLLQVGLLVSVTLSFLAPSVVANLSEFTQVVFTSDLGKFCWIILPILALVFFKGKRSRFDFA